VTVRASNGAGEAAARDLTAHGGLWRISAALFVTAGLALFAGVNAFWRYLATGQWVNFRPAAYYEDLTAPLAEIFRHPLDILTHPWMILVTGLLLGLVVFVPIVMAVAYRSRVSVPFVLAVGVLGHAPVLALAVAIGCALGGRSGLRREMPFLATILGLLPAAAYLALSALAGVDAAAVPPLQRWALYAPFLIAFVAAVLAGAVVLGLARLTRQRPSVVCLTLLLLQAAPAAAFYLKVGADELAYGLIVSRSKEQQLQADDAIFRDEALGPWVRRNGAEGLNPQTTQVRVREELKKRRDELVASCERFLADRPGSARTAAVLWLRAQATSLRLDEAAFKVGLIRCTASHPGAESAAAWRALRKVGPGAPQAALADWRLGELTLRAARRAGPERAATLVLKAEEHLGTAAEALGAFFPSVADRQGLTGSGRMFSPPADVPPPDYYRQAVESVERLVWLMRQNDVRVEDGKLVDANSAEALAAYLDLNPKEADYYKRLVGLLDDPRAKRESSAMGDNLKLAVARHTPDLYERADMLIQLARDERTDGAIVANFELGKLALRTAEDPAVVLIKDLKTPEEYFRIVIAAPPNPYQQKAAEMLASLTARAKPKE